MVPLAFGLVITGFALWFTAASGAARIPVLSSLAYEKSYPLRIVQPEKGSGLELISADALKAIEEGGTDPQALDAVFSEEQMAALTKQFAKLSSGISANHLKIDLSEGMLTESLRQTAASMKTASEASSKNEKPVFDLARAQIAVSKERGVEVYLPFLDNPQASSVRFYLRPSVLDGSLRLVLTDVWIGNLRVPPSWANAFSRGALNDALNSVAPTLKQSLVLTTLDVDEGNVHLEGTFAPGAL